MDISITIKNYRCFEQTNPATIRIKDGFTSFVGINNAGKSNLLKFFFELRPLFGYLSNPDQNVINSLYAPVGTIPFLSTGQDIDHIYSNSNTNDLIILIEFHDVPVIGFVPNKATIKINRRDHSWQLDLYFNSKKYIMHKENPTFQPEPFLNYLKDNRGEIVADLSTFFETMISLNYTLYIGPFRNAINMGASQNYFDIQTGQIFIQYWDQYKSGQSHKTRQIAIDLYEQLSLIFGARITDISTNINNTDLIITMDGKTYDLSEIGAGFAQFIIVLINVAIRQPSFILIDEPELNLHPKLQLDFLQSINRYAKQGVIFATHNIGLARIISPTVYSVRITHNKIREITEISKLENLSLFLGEVNFSAGLELGCDKILFVEGPHDIPVMRELLIKWGIAQKYALLHLGGGSTISGKVAEQLEEIKRIAGTADKVKIIIDSERKNEGDKLEDHIKDFVTACEKSEINCHVLSRRAMEHYLTDRAIKKVIGNTFSALNHYDEFNPKIYGWKKSQNHLIVREMNKNELDNTDLGQFLDNL